MSGSSVHSHRQSASPSAHHLFTRLSGAQVARIRESFLDSLPATRELGAQARRVDPERAFFSPKAVTNTTQKITRDLLGGYTPTQAFVRILNNETPHEPGYKATSFQRLDAEGRVDALLWSYETCLKRWKSFPEVIGLDNTYKTNRFGMHLFQVTTLSDQGSLVYIAFGLIAGERREHYDWLIASLESLRELAGAPRPFVVITDKEAALRNALKEKWPDVQQQLCIWHILSNVRGKIRRRFRTATGHRQEDLDDDLLDDITADDDNPDDPDDIIAATEALELQEKEVREVEDGNGLIPLSPRGMQAEEYSGEDMLGLFQAMVYAAGEESFNEAWESLVDKYLGRNQGLVDYINQEYMPWMKQWAHYFTRQYRNFGVRTNSPNESGHSSLKLRLISSRGHFIHLNKGIVMLLAEAERSYERKSAADRVRLRIEFGSRDWMGSLNTRLTRKACDLIVQQHRIIEASKKPNGSYELPPCTGFFEHQYGLPCSHTIHEVLMDGKCLQRRLIASRWWLDKPHVSPPFYSLYTC